MGLARTHICMFSALDLPSRASVRWPTFRCSSTLTCTYCKAGRGLAPEPMCSVHLRAQQEPGCVAEARRQRWKSVSLAYRMPPKAATKAVEEPVEQFAAHLDVFYRNPVVPLCLVARCAHRFHLAFSPTSEQGTDGVWV
jgi:hypothetical protein